MVEVSTEHVLVVPTELFHRLGHFQGFSPDTTSYLTELLKPAHTSYRPRGEMEEDPSFKQLIPYCVFRHVDADGREHVFAYTRGKGQGEGRLRSKRSVGIGGHISSDDSHAGDNVYQEGMRRELDEEIFIDTAYSERLRRTDQRRRNARRPGPPGRGTPVRCRGAGRPPARNGAHRMRLSARRGTTGRHERLRNLVANLPAGAVR